MKRPFILVLMLAFFALLLSSGVSVAEEKKAADKKATEPPPRAAVMKVTPTAITGKVTQADEKTKTVTILGQGGQKVTLNFSDAKAGTCTGGRRLSQPQTTFPKVGDSVVVRARVSDSCEDCLAIC